VGDSERDDSEVGSTTSDDDSSDEVQTRVMTPPGQDHPSENQTDEPTTRVETVPRPIADHLEPASQLPKEPDGVARRAVRVSVVVGELALRVLRSTAIAMILIAGWAIRSGYGLIRRKGVGRTALESRLASSLRTRSRASTEVDGSARSASRAESLPESFGRYRIVKLLGQGGMGSVYLAQDSRLDRSVALKVPRFSAGDGPEVLERFYREARAAATIEHPNVCPIYDVDEIDGHHYVSMAFVEGRPLSDLVEAGKRLTQRQAAILVRQIALAMAEAHRRGIIHRDLKPANIMINSRREPVIMDFGLARRSSRIDGRLTKSGAIVGTPAYMPPEQVKGDPDAIGPVCDIYSLGCVLYEVLTGRLPFEGSAIAVLGQVLTQDPPPPSTFRPDLDTQLEAICRKAMARKVEDRYASMVELANALGRFLKSGTPAAAGDPEPGDADISWSEFFALPPRKAPGTAPSDRPVGSTVRITPVAIWPWVAIAAVLVAALVFLATRDRETRVEVQLTGIEVTNQIISHYYLDGKRIDAEDLAGPLALKTGQHELRLKFVDGQEKTRTFTILQEDNMQTVDINRPEVQPVPPASAESSAGQRAVKVMEPRLKLPVLKKIVVVDAGEAGPGDSEDYSGSAIDARTPGGLMVANMLMLGGGPRPFRAETRYGQVLRLPSEGKYDIWWQPASGRAVRMVADFSIKDRKLVEIHPEGYLGLVRLHGKGLPEPKFVVVTPQGDGYPIQVARRYGTDLIVPAGRYDLWIKPAQGASQELIERGIEVKPGKELEFY
jgi:predicted Ser/Thr protein kinase